MDILVRGARKSDFVDCRAGLSDFPHADEYKSTNTDTRCSAAGLSDFFHTGEWGCTVRVAQVGVVLQANRKRIFSLFELSSSVFEALKKRHLKKIIARHERILLTLQAMLTSTKVLAVLVQKYKY